MLVLLLLLQLELWAPALLPRRRVRPVLLLRLVAMLMQGQIRREIAEGRRANDGGTGCSTASGDGRRGRMMWTL